MGAFAEARQVSRLLLLMAGGGLVLAPNAQAVPGAGPSAQALVPSADVDRDGLEDVLERRVGLTPGHRDDITFVDTGSQAGRCSDRNTGERLGAPGRPWCTLASAAEAAPPGTTVLVRRGTYERGTLERTRRGGVRLRAYPGEQVVLRGLALEEGRWRLERFRITAPVEISAETGGVALVRNRFDTSSGAVSLDAGVRGVLVARNRIAQRPGTSVSNLINFGSTDTRPAIEDVTIRHNRIGPVPSGGDAIQAKHTRRLRIVGNEIFGVRSPAGSGAHPDAFQSIYGAEGLVLRRNFIHDIAAQGIFVMRFRGENRRVLAEDNVVARVADPWVEFTVSAQGVKLIHNTILGTLRIGQSSRQGVLVGNIVSGLLLPPSAGIARRDHNLVGGQPRFRDARRNDFRLRRRSLGRLRGPRRSDVGSRGADWSRRGLRRR